MRCAPKACATRRATSIRCSGEFGNTDGWELVADEDTFQQIARLMQQGGDGQRQAIEQMMVLAKRVKFADNPVQAMRIGSTLEMTGSAWNELWINGLLSGPANSGNQHCWCDLGNDPSVSIPEWCCLERHGF